MSQYLQSMIDEQIAGAHDFLESGDPNYWTLKHRFSDFAAKLRDGDFEVAPSQVIQLFELMDLLTAHDHILESDRTWVLSTLIKKASLDECDDTAIINRILIASVNHSLSLIEQKVDRPVVASRELFGFFASHAKVMSDEAFKLLLDHSVILTRYAGRTTNQHNLLFGSTDRLFQQETPANLAFTSLISHHLGNYEHEIKWADLPGSSSYHEKELSELLRQLNRAGSLGVHVSMHQSDALLMVGLAANLLLSDTKGAHPDHDRAAHEAAINVLKMATPPGPLPLSENLFRFPGRPFINSFKKKTTWMYEEFCEKFHQDLLFSLTKFSEAPLADEVREAFSDFSGSILISAAQAQKNLAKVSGYKNASFLHEMAGLCSQTLEGPNPLRGLNKDERLAVIDSVQEMSVKRQLLSKYKSDKGQALMNDLGM